MFERTLVARQSSFMHAYHFFLNVHEYGCKRDKIAFCHRKILFFPRGCVFLLLICVTAREAAVCRPHSVIGNYLNYRGWMYGKIAKRVSYRRTHLRIKCVGTINFSARQSRLTFRVSFIGSIQFDQAKLTRKPLTGLSVIHLHSLSRHLLIGTPRNRMAGRASNDSLLSSHVDYNGNLIVTWKEWENCAEPTEW